MPRLFAILVVAVVAVGVPGNARPTTSGGATWNLTGTWYDTAGNPFALKQAGSALTWSAHSSDNVTWSHDFTGTISGDSFSGTYQDRPGFRHYFHGTITGRILDNCHIDVERTVAENGDVLSGRLTRKPCTRRFTFAWAARATDVSLGRISGVLTIGTLTGSGRVPMGGAGHIVKASGSVRVQLDALEKRFDDLWALDVTGGRYHEDPTATADLSVEVTAFNSDCDEKYPTGRLELRDRKSKYRDRIVIRACGRTATVVKSGTSAVAVAISEPK